MIFRYFAIILFCHFFFNEVVLSIGTCKFWRSKETLIHIIIPQNVLGCCEPLNFGLFDSIVKYNRVKLVKMAMKPCTNNQQLESLQKQALLDALKDAVKAESKRLDRLEKANPKEKAALENRFAEERLTDKTKISRLKEDFESLAVKLRSGELDISQSSRTIRTDQVGVTKIKTIDKNRFQGLESDSDVVIIS